METSGVDRVDVHAVDAPRIYLSSAFLHPKPPAASSPSTLANPNVSEVAQASAPPTPFTGHQLSGVIDTNARC